MLPPAMCDMAAHHGWKSARSGAASVKLPAHSQRPHFHPYAVITKDRAVVPGDSKISASQYRMQSGVLIMKVEYLQVGQKCPATKPDHL